MSAMSLSNVLLPAPDGPVRKAISPACISKLTPESAAEVVSLLRPEADSGWKPGVS